MIAIIDYDAGNIKSVQKAVEFLGEEAVLTSDREVILNAGKVILPGVGAFGKAMESLKNFNLIEVIHEVAESDTPFLGICLGLQILLNSSEESPGVKGLGIIDGDCLRMTPKPGFKIPHMGWNTIDIKGKSPLLKGIKQESFLYFVHSYYAKVACEDEVIARCEFTDNMDVVLQKGNVFATQFHPEKSSGIGLAILKNFIEM